MNEVRSAHSSLILRPVMVAAQVFGVGADIPHGARGTGDSGVHPPAADGALRVGQQAREPPLGVLDHHLVDPADSPFPHHVARLLDHRVAGVIVGQDKDPAGPLDHRLQFLRLLQAGAHGLVQHHVKTGLQKGFRHLEMGDVGGDDRDEIEPLALRLPGLLFRHLAIVAIDPLGVEMQVSARLHRFDWV